MEPAQIRHIRVSTFSASSRLSHLHPRNTEEAQYSLAYPVAAALLDDEVEPRQVLPPRIFNPDVLSLMDRVAIEVAEEFEAEFPAKALCEVVIETTTGDSFYSGPIEAIWEPPDTLPSDAELDEKFLWLTVPVLGERNAKKLVQAIWAADQWTSMDPIIKGSLKDR